MQVVQTADEPPNRGSSILATIGWKENSSEELTRKTVQKQARLRRVDKNYPPSFRATSQRYPRTSPEKSLRRCYVAVARENAASLRFRFGPRFSQTSAEDVTQEWREIFKLRLVRCSIRELVNCVTRLLAQ